ncbi:K(+)-transporting ATPase subunit F [Streptomyces clavifer]
MTADHVVGLAVALSLLGYLIVALVFPERF